MEYAEIVAAVKAGLRRSDKDSEIPRYINTRRRMICRDRNWSWMRQKFSAITAPNVRNYSLPQRFKDELELYWQDAQGELHPLTMLTDREALARYAQSDKGKPAAWVLVGQGFDIYPMPDDSYPLVMTCYAYLEDLSAAVTLDYMLENYPDLLIAGAVAHGLKELGMVAEAQPWEQDYALALRDAWRNDVMFRLPQEIHVKVRPDVNAPGFRR